jgi:hypothetical protein
MIKGVNYMMMMRLQAAPLVRKGRVEQFMDPKLGTQYPPGRAVKVFYPTTLYLFTLFSHSHSSMNHDGLHPCMMPDRIDTNCCQWIMHALQLARIAMCCLQENPKSRPSMADVAQTISCHIISSETSMGQAG